MMEKKVIKHLKGDIKTFKKEASEDKKLIKSLSSHEKSESKKDTKKSAKKKKSIPKGKAKIKIVMKEFKAGKLHSGSKKGPKVKSRKQAVAIALSEQRKVAK